MLRRLELPGGAPGAVLAASLFAFHPVHVESVAWITERKNVLSLLFYLAALSAYAPAITQSSDALSMRRRGLAFAFFLLALLSKTVTATLPAAILLLIYWKRGAISRRDITPLIVFFALGIGFGLTTAWLEKHHVGAQGADWSLTLVERLCLAARIALFYAGKLLWPHPLAFIYPRWDATGVAPPGAVLSLLLLGAIALLWLRRDRFGRGPLVAVLFSSARCSRARPDRCLSDAILLGCRPLPVPRLDRAPGPRRGGLALALSPLRPIPRAALLALPVLACAAGTALRTPAYRDLRTLWTDTLAKNPDAWMAHHNLGMVEFDAGRVREAIERYRAALAIREDLPNTHYNLGSALARAGHPDLALVHLERAHALDPKLRGVETNLGNVLQKLGRREEAIAHYRAALETDPDAVSARQNLAFVLADAGDLGGAIEQYRLLLERNPETSPAPPGSPGSSPPPAIPPYGIPPKPCNGPRRRPAACSTVTPPRCRSSPPPTPPATDSRTRSEPRSRRFPSPVPKAGPDQVAGLERNLALYQAGQHYRAD
ncbi:MAG: tetratricopeptide repeat protein [Candidatus Eisenbacteria bacterium]|nr:tetratricopeptide repeat protein [Candidatus Eisenbacteria bacterium]